MIYLSIEIYLIHGGNSSEFQKKSPFNFMNQNGDRDFTRMISSNELKIPRFSTKHIFELVCETSITSDDERLKISICQ